MSEINFQAELARLAARVEDIGTAEERAAPAAAWTPAPTVPRSATITTAPSSAPAAAPAVAPAATVPLAEPAAVAMAAPAPPPPAAPTRSSAPGEDTTPEARRSRLMIVVVLVLLVGSVALVTGLSAAMSRPEVASAPEPMQLPSVAADATHMMYEEEILPFEVEYVESQPVETPVAAPETAPAPRPQPQNASAAERIEAPPAPPVRASTVAIRVAEAPAPAAAPVLRPIESRAVNFTVTPDTPPVLRNVSDMNHALATRYPEHLRNQSSGMAVVVSLLLSDEGRVLEGHIERGTGNAELDAIALHVARMARFTPARQEGRNVRTRVLMPITVR